MQLILDVGSGRSLKDRFVVQDVVDAIKEVDSGKHQIVLKAQLFKEAPPNIPLDPLLFDSLYNYGTKVGYKVTASVFDVPSLKFLLNYDVPFVKIACRPDLYWLIGEIPRKVPVIVSHDMRQDEWDGSRYEVQWMSCIPEYPAKVSDYGDSSFEAVSDHTVGWEIFNRPMNKIVEKHFVMERDPGNPDAGPFACDPESLREIM
jgi:sialic acid synthase SpsE